MSVAAGTDCRTITPDQATRGATDAPPTEQGVSTRLVGTDAEPFPYTKVRDWIALLPQASMSDGAFRLYYISRSMVWENAKGGPPPRPVVEITYEEYAMILGRSARTIARFAQDLYAAGLWEVVERAHRSITVPGKSRPEVRTVLTVRVHDYPRDLAEFAGPVKTWDVLSAVRDGKRASAQLRAACETTAVSAQSDQGEQTRSDNAGCDTPEMSPQSPQAVGQDQPWAHPPGETKDTPGRCDATDVTGSRTDLSDDAGVSAGQTAQIGALKKKGEKEKPSLPPTPSAGQLAAPSTEQADTTGGAAGGPADRSSLVDELAMFSEDAAALVSHLYDKTLSSPGLQPLSQADRAGLARRIDARLAEGWTLNRIRAVLTGGSLVGVKMPGRLWAGRLDDMPTFPSVPHPRTAADNEPSGPNARHSRRRPSDRPSMVTNDCSDLPDPNPGKVRYQVPDERGVRLVTKWADDRQALPWCGRCSSETRLLRPPAVGELPRPCSECHPDPAAFPPLTVDASDADTPREEGHHHP